MKRKEIKRSYKTLRTSKTSTMKKKKKTFHKHLQNIKLSKSNLYYNFLLMLGILKFEKLGNTKQQHLKKKKHH
jgi:hypothetical protein